jgi:hypothetical protein
LQGVLKDAPNEAGPFMLRPLANIFVVNNNPPLGGGEDAGDHVKQGGFSSPVTADDGHKLLGWKMEIDTTQGVDFVNTALVKNLVERLNL